MTASEADHPFCVTFRLTADEFRSGVRRLSLGLRGFRVFLGLTALAALGAAAGYAFGNNAVAVGLLIVAVLYALLLAWIWFVLPLRQYRRFAWMAGEQTYCFTEAEVSWTFTGGGSQVKWGYFARMFETATVIVLQHRHLRLGSVIPKRVFATAADEARFRRLAAQVGQSLEPQKVTRT